MTLGSEGMRKLAAVVERNDTAFGSRVADRTVNKLDIPSGYPANTERHKLTVNGTEDREFTTNFTNQPARYELTAADGDTVEFSSREQFRYVPNYEALFGVAAWYETAADQLTSGQRLFIELSDDERDNIFGYEFTPGNTRAFIRSGGTPVDELPRSEWGDFPNATDYAGDPLDYINRDQPLNPRGFVNWYGVGEFRPTVAFTRESGQQDNVTLGHLSNQETVTTEQINLKPRVVAAADAGAPEFTVSVSSMGTLIRGGAVEFNRPRGAVFYGLGGDIGPTYANNVPLIAMRHQQDKRNVSVKLDIPEFSPSGDVTVDLLVGAVAAGETDATGFAPARQGDVQNTAVEYTTDVTTFPTETRTVPGGGTAEVPEVRPLATSVAEGAKNDPSKAEAGPGEANKRVLGEDEVALYLPRTAGSTGTELNWLRPINTQDW
jgi:hypothetical protein